MKAKDVCTTSAQRVLEMLEGHSLKTAIRILTKAIELVVTKPNHELRISGGVAIVKPPHGNTGRYKFLMDHEVRKFMAGYAQDTLNFLTIDHLRDEIRKQFGDSRTPSRGALGRYLKAQRESSLAEAHMAEVENVQ